MDPPLVNNIAAAGSRKAAGREAPQLRNEGPPLSSAPTASTAAADCEYLPAALFFFFMVSYFNHLDDMILQMLYMPLQLIVLVEGGIRNS